MTRDSDSPFDSGPFSTEIRAEIARRFGEEMAEVVMGAVARSLRETAAEAESAGLEPETAVAGFLHLCREMCEGLEEGRRDDGRSSGGLN